MTFLRRRRIHVLILVLWCALLMGTTHAIEPAADHSSVQSEGENGKGEEENEGVTAPPVGRSGAPSKIRTCDLRIRRAHDRVSLTVMLPVCCALRSL